MKRIHLVEIPKFLSGLENLRDDLERWTYFLRHGDELDAAVLPMPLAIPEIAQATGTLTMLSMNDAERDLYEARLKYSRDESARAAYATSKGFESGRIEEARLMLLRLGQRRFGPVPDSVQKQLVGISVVEELEILTERLLEISDWSELFSSVDG